MPESPFDDLLVLVKGAGDLATGVGWRLHRCGFPVVMTELPRPLAVRRMVAFAQAVFSDEHEVEGVTARTALVEDVPDVLAAGEVPVLVDPASEAVAELAPSVVVDGIVAKKNTGTALTDAPFVVALGPGFVAGEDCHTVVETNRGQMLGRAIWQGTAQPDTGKPGKLPGFEEDDPNTRVLRAPVAGRFQALARIGDRVPSGELVGTIQQASGEEVVLLAPFTGVLRGLLHESVPVAAGLKVGDVDPRSEPHHAFLISDKSLAIGGGVLEAILYWHFGKGDDAIIQELGV